jgi:hypothetical protein
MAGVMKGLLRVLAMISGLLGAIIALFVDIFNTIGADVHKGFGNGHFFIGLFAFLIGLIGALVAVPFPVTAAVLMVVSSAGLIWVAGGWAFFAVPFLVLGAILAFVDRKKGQAETKQA